jgi:hypothetical protein
MVEFAVENDSFKVNIRCLLRDAAEIPPSRWRRR